MPTFDDLIKEQKVLELFDKLEGAMGDFGSVRKVSWPAVLILASKRQVAVNRSGLDCAANRASIVGAPEAQSDYERRGSPKVIMLQLLSVEK